MSQHLDTANKSHYQQLLRDLKTTVERLLNSQANCVWNIYGGLNRLHVDLEKIFRHGCKGSSDQTSDTNYWGFMQGLKWLQPESLNTFDIDCENATNLPSHVKKEKCSIWLYRTLENHSLSQKLSWLLSDRNHVLDCYRPDAFLCQQEYAEAVLICLKAIELNQATLISEIKPHLLIHNTGVTKSHRRCVSFQDSHLKLLRQHTQHTQSQKKHQNRDKMVTNKLRTWKSMPNVYNADVKPRNRSNTISRISTSQPQSPRIKNKAQKNEGKPSTSKSLYQDSPKVQITATKHVLINCDIVEHTPPKDPSVLEKVAKKPTVNLGSSAPEFGFLSSFAGISAGKDVGKLPKKTFIEDGGLSVLPMATGYFPKPLKGQSMTSFLLRSQFSRGNAELDRENAHFGICEAVIAAMAQIKSKKDLDQDLLLESDEEINLLKQRIRVRRKQKMVEERKKPLFNNSLSDARTDTTSASPSSISSSTGSFSSSISSEEEISVEFSSTLQDDNPGLSMSMSMASLYSDADIFKRPRGAPDGASDILSAEGVALSLISKFSEKQLPRASDLEWLVSEEDAPQALLPLPKSWPVNPDDYLYQTPLRGTKDWAPPRPQIIFTLLNFTSRNDIMESQNYRCAGCGTRVAQKYASKFRYCHYLGRYFCTGCHTNQLALIPARIIHKWNFARCSVSTFSYRLIEQMYTDPLFRVFQLNKTIGKLSKTLLVCKKYREGMYFLKDYILTCRFAETIQDYIKSEKNYMFNDPDVYSLEDLVNVRTGELKSKLKFIVEQCCRHTSECQLCRARGFLCEICNGKDILYPWQSKIVNRCSNCGTCFHDKCWTTKNPCPRCARLHDRATNVQKSVSSSL